ncbi:MAG: fasciclin domain-containing protein [Cyclobacteriaceae bacterium]
MNQINKNFIFLLAASLLLVGCIDENYEEPIVGQGSAILSNVIEHQSELTVFSDLIEMEGLLPLLVSRQTQDQRAVFAPTNSAIEVFMSENGYGSASDIEGLERVLAYHLAQPNITLSTLSQTNFNFIQTEGDQNIFINRSGGQVRFNNQEVNILRSEFGNGTVHLIDQVLLPRANSMAAYIEDNPELSIFKEVIEVLGMESQFSEEFRTFFIPNNQAFLDLLAALEVASLEELIETVGEETLEEIVMYHIVNDVVYSANVSNDEALPTQFVGEVSPRISISGGTVSLTYGEDNATSTLVSVNDDIFQTGFVHVIDKVMMPVFETE